MSEELWLTAARNQLRTELSLEDLQCDVELEPFAPPAAGNLYLAVIPSDWTSDRPDGGHLLSEQLGITVAVIKRCGYFPVDRRRNVLMQNLTGLNVIVRNVMLALNMQYSVLDAVNAALSLASAHQRYYQPLRWLNNGRVEVVDGSRWYADDPEKLYGLVREVRFGGAATVQTATGAT